MIPGFRRPTKDADDLVLNLKGVPVERRARTSAPKWNLTGVKDNLVFAGDRIIAWYLAAPQTWSFRSVAEAEQLIYDQATQLAELVGTTVHGRVTTRPYPVQHWARAAWDNAPAPRPGFADMMERDQRHMSAHAQADKLVYYGVDLGQRGLGLRTLSTVMAGAIDREVRALRDRLDYVGQVMRGVGLEAEPVSGKDLEWLLARSFALGCPVPVPDPDAPDQTLYDSDDLAEFVNTSSWWADPLAPCVQVTTSVNDRQHTRHVCVLTVARVGDLSIPESAEPWQSMTDRLPFPVEWSWRVVPRSAEAISKEMGKLADRIDSQVDHWSVDHGKRPPKQLGRQRDRAAEVEDEQRREFTGLSTRTLGWYRLAVAGETEQEALDRARAVVDLYKPQIKVSRDLGQYHLAREFVPGEPLATTAHARKFPVLKVAAGVPAITAEVGDRRGFHIAETGGLSARAVCFDPWYLPEVREAGGLYPLVGTLGSGKSTLMGVLIYKAILSGVRGVCMDPAGRLQKLVTLPEIAPLARSVDLLGGDVGSLSPYRVVPEPNSRLIELEASSRDDFADKMRLADTAAESMRRDLTFNTLRWCLSYQFGRKEEVQDRLRDAINRAPAYVSSSANAVIGELRLRDDELSQRLIRELDVARERELGRLFFPGEARHVRAGRMGGDAPALFTFFNLKGLLAPDPNTSPIEEWMPEELLVKPIMTLAAWSALDLVYRGDPNERKLFALDEAHEVTDGSGAGRSLVYKLATDSRKNNCATFVSTQNAGTVLGQNINNFVGAAFVGRTSDEAAQRDAVRLLGKPVGVGYEEMLGRLSAKAKRSEKELGYREFIYRDGLGGENGMGGMEKIVVTLRHHPSLAEALNTTPNRAKVIDSPATQRPAWAIDDGADEQVREAVT